MKYLFEFVDRWLNFILLIFFLLILALWSPVKSLFNDKDDKEETNKIQNLKKNGNIELEENQLYINTESELKITATEIYDDYCDFNLILPNLKNDKTQLEVGENYLFEKDSIKYELILLYSKHDNHISFVSIKKIN